MSIGINTEAGEKLKSYADRMERLMEDIDGLRDDLKDLKAQAKGDGFNVQALGRLVAIRRDKRRLEVEAELLNDLVLYAYATGTPLDVISPEIESGSEIASPSPSRSPAKVDPAAESAPFD